MFCCLIIHILHVNSARTFEIRILVKNKNKIQKYVVVNGRLRESPESTGSPILKSKLTIAILVARMTMNCDVFTIYILFTKHLRWDANHH